MAITEASGGSPSDMLKITWDLVEGFGELARVNARHCTMEQARTLLAVTERLHRYALLFERETLADQLEQASFRLGQVQ